MCVGVKFCGGCNPVYERIKVFKRLKEEFKDTCLEVAEEGKEYEVILLFHGCNIKCTRFEGLVSKSGFVDIASEDDYDKAAEKIREVIGDEKK